MEQKKNYEEHAPQSGDKKGSVNNGGYNEQHKQQSDKKNPGVDQDQGNLKEDTSATQDDTAGGNDSGKRSDDD